MRRQLPVSFLALGLLLAAGCVANESLNPPPAPTVPSGGAMFQTYVSMGNSITAGFQSAGINDSTQQRSYAVLLSKAMGTSFVYPSLNGRGCPPPFDINTTQHRVGGGTGATCDLRATSAVPNNVAVPGARAEELLTNFGVPVSASNALTLLFLGGKTQVQRMTEAKPSFVSLWIGNNDVLGSLTNLTNPGNPALVTPLSAFTAEFDSVTDAIAATNAKAVLVGVADVASIPYASLGATYWCIKNQPACGAVPAAFPDSFKVNNNCAPALAVPGAKGDSTLVPWPIWIPQIVAALGGTPVTLDCTDDNTVVTASEFANLRTAVVAFNAHIQTVATAHGWAYWDPNPTLYAEVQSGANPTGRIPAFPDLSNALIGGPIGFGALFTQDGVHPSATTHRIVADSLAATINAKYGSSLPVPVCAGAITCPAP